MVLIIFATLLILGIALYQATRGFFSAMIMTILTILCLAIAFNFYDRAGDALANRLGAYAHPSVLLALFVIPLLILREIFDRFVPGNVQVELLWADRAIGSIFGLITGTILTGMLMIILQLLPMPASVITYQPYDSTLVVKQSGPVRWAGEFTLGLAKHLSAGSLQPIGKGTPFGIVHDDLLLEAFCLRSRPCGGEVSARTDALELVDAHIVAEPTGKERRAFSPDDLASIRKIQQATPLYRPMLTEETHILTVRVKVDESARNERDNWWRLPATHFRLVCKNGRSYYPVGYLTHVADWQVNTATSEDGFARVTDIIVARPWSKEGGPHKLIIDWIYRISADDEPSYLVFRRTAKASLPRWHLVVGLPAVNGALSVKPVYGKVEFAPFKKRLPFTPLSISRHDNLPHRISLRFYKDNIPPYLRDIAYDQGRLRRGLIKAPAEELKRVKIRRHVRSINYLAAPNGQTVFQVPCKVDPMREKQLQETLKRISPKLVLDNHKAYPWKGVYAFYNTGGKSYVYLYYNMGKAGRHLPDDFTAIFTPSAKNMVEEFGFIFLVPDTPERSITSLDLSLPGYDALPTVKPLSCSLRRRRRVPLMRVSER